MVRRGADERGMKAAAGVFPDPNNNLAPKYGLRPRAGASRQAGGARRPGAAPLSKYRRRTANARERSRMREINAAFEALRRCVGGADPSQDERMTKISTLRLAARYIAALAAALQEPQESSSEDLSPGAELCLSPDLSLPPLSPLSPLSTLSSAFPESPLSPFDPFFTEFS